MRISLFSIILLLFANGCARRAAEQTVAHEPPASANAPPETKTLPPAAPRVVRPYDGVVVHIDGNDSFVEITATVCLDEGFLEQVACAPNSREHESLVVVSPAQPSQIHAALLLAGFSSGSPGKWTYENRTLGTIAPTGEKLEILVSYTTSSGDNIQRPVREWIRGAARRTAETAEPVHEPFPKLPWVFGGSGIAANPPQMGPGEHYIADMTGSIIGIVTFGDETIGFSHVFSDQEDVQAPEWEVNTPAMPPMETPVRLIVRRWKD